MQYRRLLILLLATLLLVASCSGTEDDDTGAGGAASSSSTSGPTPPPATSTSSSTTSSAPQPASPGPVTNGCGDIAPGTELVITSTGSDFSVATADGKAVALDLEGGALNEHDRTTLASVMARDARSIRAVVPTGSEARPVLLDFHGYSGNAAQQLRYSRLGDVAGPRGYLVVAIDGRDQIRRWVLADTDAEPDAMGASDVAVVDAVLDLILEPLCGSTDAIHAAGMSNGAVFAAVYGCASRHGVDAVATVAFTTGRAGCGDDSQIPTLAIHGTGDPVVPYEGRDLPLIRTVLGWSLEPAEEAMQHKADLNGCDGADDERIGADVTRRTWRNCDAETVFYRVDGGGHGWPGPGQPASGFGRTTETIDATQLIVDFFDRN